MLVLSTDVRFVPVPELGYRTYDKGGNLHEIWCLSIGTFSRPNSGCPSENFDCVSVSINRTGFVIVQRPKHPSENTEHHQVRNHTIWMAWPSIEAPKRATKVEAAASEGT